VSCPALSRLKAGAGFQLGPIKLVWKILPNAKDQCAGEEFRNGCHYFVPLKNSFFVKVSVPASWELGGAEARLGILRAFLPRPHALDTLYSCQ
jgi:hypothetical protein